MVLRFVFRACLIPGGVAFSLIPNENDCTLAIVVLMIMIFYDKLLCASASI